MKTCICWLETTWKKTGGNRSVLVEQPRLRKHAVADGVPQGSILGPTLILCYINDLIEWNLSRKVSLYADDTVLYTSGNSAGELCEKINRNLSILHGWSSHNRLTVNPQKTKAALFKKFYTRNFKRDLPVDVGINGVSLILVDKYVGP